MRKVAYRVFRRRKKDTVYYEVFLNCMFGKLQFIYLVGEKEITVCSDFYESFFAANYGRVGFILWQIVHGKLIGLHVEIGCQDCLGIYFVETSRQMKIKVQEHINTCRCP